MHFDHKLMHPLCNLGSEDNGAQSNNYFRISNDLVGAGRFERPTPCAQGTIVGSKGSIVFR